ncbi:unnamed protein product [Gongylonema pulchrum]|uniref:CACTA en-spm transposon protein n=1 Tax=Gongylonema pulchrum TaxID=637853 RepID=A0A183D259_9BILA|nr:unnamed protein product [Gongylonema pulchrum]
MRNCRPSQETVKEREENALNMQRRREITEIRIQERMKKQESGQHCSVSGIAVMKVQLRKAQPGYVIVAVDWYLTDP